MNEILNTYTSKNTL